MGHEHKSNHEEEDRYITLINDNGDEELFEILLTFDSEDFEKSYVLFYPVGASEDGEEGEVHAYAYIPTEDGGFGELMPIETDEEWDMVEEVFNTFLEDEDED
ncbi:DUF1292 domain-containing protein [Neobacillus sp. OS1-32]|jgi:uncharacterized protein YrzB (UPF0473 family)|uniref:DUF1292 domain-containing protein n=1 Tax=Neobacillus sp. OS1-32 TaxID=3070682 RepID=UPI0027E09370|nr:DUF1292 domain-containing protein [Neobacillus sp. OS1-32]WML30614.1 DUF1292 domain-containing protein [Neobacillus sp. OS1-32]